MLFVRPVLTNLKFNSVTMTIGEPVVKTWQIADEIVSLEQTLWAHMATTAGTHQKKSAGTHAKQCEEYAKTNRLQLRFACNLCPDLVNVCPDLKNFSISSQANGPAKTVSHEPCIDEFNLQEMLNIYTDIVSSLDGIVGKDAMVTILARHSKICMTKKEADDQVKTLKDLVASKKEALDELRKLLSDDVKTLDEKSNGDTGDVKKKSGTSKDKPVALGSKWMDVGEKKPTSGNEIMSVELRKAIQQKLEFSDEEVAQFNFSNLTNDSYILVAGKYFQPESLEEADLESLTGKFFKNLVLKMGDERARTEFILMLDTWKSKEYTGINAIQSETDQRACVIENSSKKMKEVCIKYADGVNKDLRKLAYDREQGNIIAQERILRFAKDGLIQRHARVNFFVPVRHGLWELGKLTSWNSKMKVEIADFTQIRQVFHEILRCEINLAESIAVSLIDLVVLNSTGGTWQEAGTTLGPVLEKMEWLIQGLSSSLNVMRKTARIFQRLAFDVLNSADKPNVKNDVRNLADAYNRGSIAAKQVQARARAMAAQDYFSRQDGMPEKQISTFCNEDLTWMCNESMTSELWLLDCKLYKQDYADQVQAWLDRSCVGGELMRMVSHLDDVTLQQPHFQRRFLTMLAIVEAACNVLPVTSKNDFMPTARRFFSVKTDFEQDSKRLREGKNRIQSRWSDMHNTKNDYVGSLGAMDKTSRWEFRRAETRFWYDMTLLYLKESPAGARQSHMEHIRSNRRSVMRCLELLDDTVFPFTAENSGRIAELHLESAADEWEARIMGMLTLQHTSCKLHRECIVNNTNMASLSSDLPIGDIASGDRKELRLCEPDPILAAFLASFVACACPSSVRVFIHDQAGKTASQEAPIILVAGGGLAPHISTSEDGLKLLDFSGKRLSCYGLRLLVEAARADEDLVEATLAGVNSFDFSEDESAIIHNHAQHQFKRKEVVEVMHLQSNNFGKEDSLESIQIICNIIVIVGGCLQALNLGSNHITAAGAMMLARFLERGGAPFLKNLYVPDNQLQDDGAQHLSRVLTSKNQEITLLDMAKNKIEWQGAMYISDAIASASCLLTVLNLAGNSIGNPGLVALAAALSFNASLHSLDISENVIGDIGVEALSHRWRHDNEKGSLHSLTSLNLRKNDITLLGSQKLFGVDFDKLAPKLSFLSLSANKIGYRGIERIAHLLSSCKILQSLCLETQESLHCLSDLNRHQLLVDSEISSDEVCTKAEAKLHVLSDLRLSTILALDNTNGDSELSKAVRHYCSPQDKGVHIKSSSPSFYTSDADSSADKLSVGNEVQLSEIFADFGDASSGPLKAGVLLVTYICIFMYLL